MRWTPLSMSEMRCVTPEILDGLSRDDPGARRSRQDLRRIHRLMGTRTIVRRAGLAAGRTAQAEHAPLRVLELGAGDGTLMLDVARLMQSGWPAVQLNLLDRVELVDPATIAAYQQVRWTAVTTVTDVLDWVEEILAATSRAQDPQHWDLVIAHLFLHHFTDGQLARMFKAIAARSDEFFACEPRRSRLSWLGSILVGAIGANAITRADAVASVRAGFRGRELEALWVQPAGAWTVREYSAGLFSHCFHARRNAGLAVLDDSHANSI